MWATIIDQVPWIVIHRRFLTELTLEEKSKLKWFPILNRPPKTKFSRLRQDSQPTCWTRQMPFRSRWPKASMVQSGVLMQPFWRTPLCGGTSPFEGSRFSSTVRTHLSNGRALQWCVGNTTASECTKRKGSMPRALKRIQKRSVHFVITPITPLKTWFPPSKIPWHPEGLSTKSGERLGDYGTMPGDHYVSLGHRRLVSI